MKRIACTLLVAGLLAPVLPAQTYFQTDFESDAVGAQPAGDYTISPSSNTAINGAVVIDATSTPANPLSGISLYVYDAGGASGQSTHLRRPFNGGTNVSNLRVDFDFQRAFATDLTDVDTRVHFAVARAGDSLNNSDFRPFEIRILNNGTLVMNSVAGTEDLGAYLTDTSNHLTLLLNSHDTNTVDFDDPTLGTGTLQPNTLRAFLNNTDLGAFTFHQTPDPVNAPQIDFYAENSDLGQFAFYQDTSRQGGIVFDNLSVRSVSAAVPTLAAATNLAGQPASSTSIDLTWVDNATGETDTVVERKVAGGEFSIVAQLAADTEGYTDTGLVPETTYTYRVITSAGVVVSDPSNEAAVTTSAQLEPLIFGQTIPGLVVAGDDATVSISVHGQAPLSYQWYTGTSGDTSSPISGATSSTLSLPALAATTNVWARVTNGIGSVDSATFAVTVRTAVASTVTNPSQLTAAIAAAGPGDTILLADGIWPDLVIRMTGDGTETHPITLGAVNPGAVTLTGESRIEIGGTWLVVRDFILQGTYTGNDDEVIQFRRGSGLLAENCRLTNVSVIDYVPADGTDTDWVSLYGRNNRVDHCYFSGHDVVGVTLVVWPDGQPNLHRIDHNHFANRIDGAGENGWETIRIGTSDVSMTSSQTTVDYNLFTRVNGEIEIISNKTGDNVYRYNTFVECEGTLTLRHGDRCVVDSNTFIGRGFARTGGVRVIGVDHVITNNYFEGTTARDGAAITVYAGVSNSPLNGYFAAHRATIAFNTFVDNTGLAIEIGTGLGSSDRTIVPTGVRLANNLMARTTAGTAAFVGGANPTDQTWTTNLIVNGTAGITAPGGFIAADPQLRWNPLRQQYLPAAAGAAAHAATTGIIAVPLDIEGRDRDVAPDIGAFELSSGQAAVIRGPVSAVATGPSYLGADRLPGEPNGRLVNHSTRATSTVGEGVLIGGFVVGGTQPKSLLVRAVGPSLVNHGVVSPMAQPALQLFNRSGAVIASNTGWGNGPAADLREAALATGAFALDDGSLDSALAITLNPGAYTAHASPADSVGGVVLLEVYDLTEGQSTLFNQSMRGAIGPGQDVFIAGFVVGGTGSRRVLIRAAGPALTGLGVNDAISNPRLELYDDANTVIAENDAWSGGASATEIESVIVTVGAFPFAAGSGDAALLIDLAPGLYTAHAAGEAGATGIVLVEIYLVD